MEQTDLNRLAELTNHSDTGVAVGSQFKGLIYALQGQGKTHWSLELLDRITADGKAILHIDTSDNGNVAWQCNNKTGLVHPYVRIPWTTVEDVRLITQAIEEGIEPYNIVGSVILDEATSMSDDDIDRIHDQRFRTGDTKEETPGWTEYRIAYSRFRRMVANLYAIPGLHVIMVCHEKDSNASKEKQPPFYKPAFIPSIGEKITKPVHVAGRLTAEIKTRPGGAATYERHLQIHPTKTVFAKSKLGLETVKFDAEEFKNYLVSVTSQGELPEAPAEEALPDDMPEAVVPPSADGHPDIESDIADFSPIS